MVGIMIIVIVSNEYIIMDNNGIYIIIYILMLYYPNGILIKYQWLYPLTIKRGQLEKCPSEMEVPMGKSSIRLPEGNHQQ
jgi:hypothetical protein